MKWTKTIIGEHCTVTSSKRFHLSERSSEGVPFYCSKEIIKKVNGEEIVKCDFIREDFYEKVKNQFGVPQAGDLLITTRGTYGIPYIYSETDRFYFADGNITWLKDFDTALLPQYLYYWILSYEGRKKIDAIAKGTAQKAVPIASIKRLELGLPPVEIQCHIVDILSSYDKLIENKKRQIRLLEETAQRLYKEWFVNLRFPGYEKTKIVDNVPKGWKNDQLEIVGKFTRGKTITKADTVEGDIAVVAGGLEPAYYHNISNTEAPVIAISGSGANAGFVRMYYKKVWASDCSYVDKNNTNYIYYLYCLLKNNKKAIDNLQKGAAQLHVYAKDINTMKVLIAREELIDFFEKTVEPIFTKIKNCSEVIENAIQARDRLLPHLLNGELEV